MFVFNSKFKSSVFFTTIFLISSLLVACEKENKDLTKNEMTPQFMTENGWACTQLIKDSGETVANIVSFFNFFRNEQGNQYVSISKGMTEGIETIYKSTGEWSYKKDTLLLKNTSKEFLLTDKTMEKINNVLSESDKESLLFFLSSNNLSGGSAILTIQEQDSNYFQASNDDLEFTCFTSSDVGVFFNDDIEKNHRLVQKLEE